MEEREREKREVEAGDGNDDDDTHGTTKKEDPEEMEIDKKVAEEEKI